MTDASKALAASLRAARTRLGMTLDDAAGATGLGRDLISRLETGRRTMDVDTLIRVAHAYAAALDVEPTELLEGATMSGREIQIGHKGMATASAIRTARERTGTTLIELAERLAAKGRRIPANSIANIETGKRRVDIDDLFAFADALDVPAGDLIGESIVAGRIIGAIGEDVHQGEATKLDRIFELADRLPETVEIVIRRRSTTTADLIKQAAGPA